MSDTINNRRLWATLCGLFMATVGNNLSTQAHVLVTLSDGQTIVADSLDRADDGKTAILSREEEGIRIQRRLPWTRIVSVTEEAALSSAPASGSHHDAISPVGMQAPFNPAITPGCVPAAWQAEPPSFSAPASDWGELVVMPAFAPGVVVGVRQDPLEAYRRRLALWYPDGVPQLEAGFARALMQSEASYRATPPPWAVQGTVNTNVVAPFLPYGNSPASYPAPMPPTVPLRNPEGSSGSRPWPWPPTPVDVPPFSTPLKLLPSGNQE